MSRRIIPRRVNALLRNFISKLEQYILKYDTTSSNSVLKVVHLSSRLISAKNVSLNLEQIKQPYTYKPLFYGKSLSKKRAVDEGAWVWNVALTSRQIRCNPQPQFYPKIDSKENYFNSIRTCYFLSVKKISHLAANRPLPLNYRFLTTPQTSFDLIKFWQIWHERRSVLKKN